MAVQPEKKAVLAGDPPLELTLRRSARARRLTLRVSSLDGRVTVTLPPNVDVDEALAFARTRQAWIRRHLAQVASDVSVDLGAVVPVAGVPHTIVAAHGAPHIGQAEICVRAGRPVAPQVGACLKQAARSALTALCADQAARLGRPYRKITLRDTRSRWGSCSSGGNLMFSWRLVMAPKAVLEYVAAHEVAHLRHMDHSPRFWATVAELMPGFPPHRAWLRQNGAGLHAYRFGD